MTDASAPHSADDLPTGASGTPEPDPLAALLPACVDGDPAAWARFVEDSVRLVRAAVRKAVGTGSAALDPDDIVQDVYIRLVRNDFDLLRRFDPARARLGTWVTLIARSVAIDALRRRRLPTVALGEAARAVPDEEAPEAGPREDRLGPDVPLHLLTDRQALVLRLLFEDGRTVPEAASILGVNEQTVRSTKHKALARLRPHASPDGEFTVDPQG